MIRPKHYLLGTLIATVCCCTLPEDASAQFDFLKSLFNGQQQLPARFAGHGQLGRAVQQAAKGEIKESLQSARDAFQAGGPAEPFGNQDAMSISQMLLQLSQVWGEKNAPAGEVAEVLRDAVLPLMPEGEVFPYPSRWQLSYDVMLLNRTDARLPMPDSVAAELVRWTVLAKQTDELRERLKVGLASEKRAAIARVIGVQLAVAENDAAAATKHLERLTEDAKLATGAALLEWMCHAVTAASRDKEAEAAGLELLEAILDRAEETLTTEAGLKSNASSLRIQAARQHVRAGRSEIALRLVKSVLDKPPVADQRFGAEYGLYLRRAPRLNGAAVLLEAGLVAEALEILGPIAEEPEPRAIVYWNRPNIGAMLGRELQKLPALERFELLRSWVLPSGERTATRDLTDFVPDVLTAAQMPESPANEAISIPRAGLLRDVYSTGWHLFATAKELGKLDDVIKELAAVREPSPHLDALRTLAAVVREGGTDAEPRPANQRPEAKARLQELLGATIQKLPTGNDQIQAPFPTLTLAVAAEAARRPEWRVVSQKLLERLIEHSQIIQWDRPRAHARMTLMEVMRLNGAGNPQSTSLANWAKLQPMHWIEAGLQSAAQHASGSLPGVWYVHEGYIQHLTSAYESELSFEFPLTGKFEVSFECREGGWSEGNAGYGGAQMALHGYANAANLSGKGRSGYGNGPDMSNLLHTTPWNRYTIQVDGDDVRYLANGHVVFEDQPGASAPWLTLGSDWGRTPIFRNFKWSGTPVIPREVPLLTSARLRGWVATHFEETRSDPLRGPRRYLPRIIEQDGQKITTMVEVEGDDANSPQAVTAVEPVADWMFTNGELTSSRRENFWPGASESWLYYQRPLRGGDSLRYEFFHQPGQTDAAPTIGRIAYQFSAEGVTRHQITDGTADVYATRAENGVLEKKPLALNEADWNVVEVTLVDEQLTITLNGKAAVTENIDAIGGTAFGFFHDAARTSLRVRNAVLSGQWPSKWTAPLQAAIESPEPTEELPNSRLFTHIIGEDRISDNAYEVYRRALQLDVNRRFEFLRRWVLPTSSHDMLRMAGAFTPTHPAPPVLEQNPIDVAMAEARQAVDQRFVQTGGNFVCPAILLVLAAAETDRLEELKQEVLKHPPESSLEMARNRAALLGVIALLQDRPEETLANVWECHRLVTEQQGPQFARWGDVALASLAIQHPATCEAAYLLLDRIKVTQLQAGKPGNPEFARYVRHLHGHAQYLMYGGSPEQFGSQPRTNQWRTVTQPSAKSRGEGYPIASFDVVAGELAQRGGHDFDGAYFQSPLRGNYEVRCRISHFDYRESILMASGIANALRYSHNYVQVLHVRTPGVDLPLAVPIKPRVLQWHDYKVVVQDGRYASFVNGQKLYEEELPDQPDPWLAVVGFPIHASRAARDIVISGEPEIPSELDLLGPPGLKGWMTDYYGSEIGQSPFTWKQTSGELTCDQTPNGFGVTPQLKIENIVRYHRPLLEDGEISYEFFYDPETKVMVDDSARRIVVNGAVRNSQREVRGRSIVHPALDRLVCMIEPDGVKIHWLTDGRWDRTGLTAGNVEVTGALRDPAAAARSDAATKLPLKERDWNSVKLATRGDTLTIELNGQPVLTREIEPTNLRHFGLFHYANESNVRVRNIRYRGDWPKTLPSAAQQDLAAGPQKLAEIPDADLPDATSWDFTKSRFNATEFNYWWGADAANHLHPTDAGLWFHQPAGETKSQVAGIYPKLMIHGDFVATLDYVGLKTVPAKESWGTGLSFKAQLADSCETGFEARQWTGSEAKVTAATWQLVSPYGPHLYASEQLNDFPVASRLRLQRRGPVMYYFIADPGSDKFRLITQRPVGTNDIKQLNIQADTSDVAGGAEFVLKSLLIRAAKITKLE